MPFQMRAVAALLLVVASALLAHQAAGADPTSGSWTKTLTIGRAAVGSNYAAAYWPRCETFGRIALERTVNTASKPSTRTRVSLMVVSKPAPGDCSQRLTAQTAGTPGDLSKFTWVPAAPFRSPLGGTTVGLLNGTLAGLGEACVYKHPTSQPYFRPANSSVCGAVRIVFSNVLPTCLPQNLLCNVQDADVVFKSRTFSERIRCLSASKVKATVFVGTEAFALDATSSFECNSNVVYPVGSSPDWLASQRRMLAATAGDGEALQADPVVLPAGRKLLAPMTTVFRTQTVTAGPLNITLVNSTNYIVDVYLGGGTSNEGRQFTVPVSQAPGFVLFLARIGTFQQTVVRGTLSSENACKTISSEPVECGYSIKVVVNGTSVCNKPEQIRLRAAWQEYTSNAQTNKYFFSRAGDVCQASNRQINAIATLDGADIAVGGAARWTNFVETWITY